MKAFRGSRDTETKLDKLRQYLQAYSTALQNQNFARIYIDAFAGSGTRTTTHAALPLFDRELTEPIEIQTPGSARIALSIEPEFHTLVLIESDPDRFQQLQTLASEYPERKIKLHQGDANEAVARICAKVPWNRQQHGLQGMRGVIFLDPFGMEVSWSTVEAIASTQALDCWYFFPLSGLYRNAPNSAPKLDASKRESLNKVFGTDKWFDEWYDHDSQPTTLFETPSDAVRRADVDAMEAYVKRRLGTVFKGTVLDPLRLYHNSGAPLASLFFSVANPKPAAVQLATRIAGHILKPGV